MLKNLVKIERNLAQWMWEKPQILEDKWRYDEILKVIKRTLDSCQKLMSDNGQAPADLPGPSRKVYCWLQFLLIPENLTRHLQALALARNLLDTDWKSRLEPPMMVEMVNRSAFYRYRSLKKSQKLVISEGMIAADADIWNAVFSNLFVGKSVASDHLIKAFMATGKFRDVLLAMESQIEHDHSKATGEVHCLLESFERVNRQYFDDSLQPPRLVWSRDFTYHKFGHYLAARDTLMLSKTLDQKHVPRYLIDFVMYHELLHKIIDTEVHAGRRRVHSAAFRRRERQFSRYADARKALSDLAARSRP